MYTHYTYLINESYFGISDPESASIFLTDPTNFRPFYDGLTEAILHGGYHGSITNENDKINFLYNRLRITDPSTKKDFSKTIKGWFIDKRVPKRQSRDIMFKICFALNYDYEQTEWFFGHVYFDRCCNCHIISEAVYYYCFLNRLPYSKAKQLINSIETSSATYCPDIQEDSIYTNEYKEQISTFRSEDELINYLVQHKHDFNHFNQQSKEIIENYITAIKGKGDKFNHDIIRSLKQRLTDAIKNQFTSLNCIITRAELEHCGLLIREIYKDASNESTDSCQYIYEKISGKDVFSNLFMLNSILWNNCDAPSNMDAPFVSNLPQRLIDSFPSEKTLSKTLGAIINKHTNTKEKSIDTYNSYESIRNILILLNFYYFWCTSSLDHNYSTAEGLQYIYNTEADECLQTCGFEPLFPGNPYDWVFLYASNQTNPLASFRDLMRYFYFESESVDEE